MNKTILFTLVLILITALSACIEIDEIPLSDDRMIEKVTLLGGDSLTSGESATVELLFNEVPEDYYFGISLSSLEGEDERVSSYQSARTGDTGTGSVSLRCDENSGTYYPKIKLEQLGDGFREEWYEYVYDSDVSRQNYTLKVMQYGDFGPYASESRVTRIRIPFVEFEQPYAADALPDLEITLKDVFAVDGTSGREVHSIVIVENVGDYPVKPGQIKYVTPGDLYDEVTYAHTFYRGECLLPGESEVVHLYRPEDLFERSVYLIVEAEEELVEQDISNNKSELLSW